VGGSIQTRKPQIQFFLKEKSRSNLNENVHGVRRLSLKRLTEMTYSNFKGCFRATGTLYRNKWVTYRLPNGEREFKIKVSCHKRISQKYKSSSFLQAYSVSYNFHFVIKHEFPLQKLYLILLLHLLIFICTIGQSLCTIKQN